MMTPLQDRIDADRYRFIRDHYARMQSPHMGGQHCWTFRFGYLKPRGPNFDAAIDAAMEKLADTAEREGE